MGPVEVTEAQRERWGSWRETEMRRQEARWRKKTLGGKFQFSQLLNYFIHRGCITSASLLTSMTNVRFNTKQKCLPHQFSPGCPIPSTNKNTSSKIHMNEVQACLKLLLSGNLPSTKKMPSAPQKEGDEFHISFVKVKRFKPAQQEIFCQLANGEKRQF